MLASSHSLYEEDELNRISCARCHNSFNKKDPCLKAWLVCSCVAIGKDTDRPVTIPYEEIHLGNRVTHISHSLFKFRGIVFCNKCGTKGSAKLHKLSSPCLPPTQYGISNLKALRAGKLP